MSVVLHFNRLMNHDKPYFFVDISFLAFFILWWHDLAHSFFFSNVDVYLNLVFAWKLPLVVPSDIDFFSFSRIFPKWCHISRQVFAGLTVTLTIALRILSFIFLHRPRKCLRFLLLYLLLPSWRSCSTCSNFLPSTPRSAILRSVLWGSVINAENRNQKVHISEDWI